jgi:shikimate kinase
MILRTMSKKMKINPADIADQLRGVNLYLIGMMGSGKTSTAAALAQLLDYRFFDTDALIEQVSGQSIRQIFALQGESEFRRLETQVLAELSPYAKLAIATGGGIVINPLNWSYLHHGLVIGLQVPLAELAQRLQQDQSRPLLQGKNPQQQLQSLWEQRQRFYAQADIQVPVAAQEDCQQVAEKILAAIARTLAAQIHPPQP